MIPIAFVENRTSGVVRTWRPDWAKLSERLARCDIGEKDGRGWMPADIDLGQRTAERVKSVIALVLDVEADAENVKDDSGKPLLDANGDHIKQVVGPEPPDVDAMLGEVGLWGWRCILHTSYSHLNPETLPLGIEHPRYRLVFDLNRPLHPAEVKPLGLHVAALLGIGDCIDTGAIEPARLFYLPRCPADRKDLFCHAETQGDALPVDALLADAAKINEAKKSALATRRTGQSGSVIEAFNDANDVGLILEQHGYQQRGRRRWIWSGSTSGLPGVRLLPDSTPERVYSSHGGDPLNDDHAHDAFDLWKILRHGGDVSAAVKDAAQMLGIEAVKRPIAGAQKVGAGDTAIALPEPLPSLPAVLPFDYDYLPGGLRGYVKDISERMQCPPDFAAVAVFVMMATIIGRKVCIRPMRQDDWTVICNLWGAVVGNSGVMKSPTLSAGLAPIKQLQAWAYEDFNNRMAEYAAQDEIAKLQKSVAKSEVKKKLSKDKSADVAALLKPDSGGDAPVLKRYMTNNASYEALGELLMENPSGLMVESDEIIGLLKQLDTGGQEVARSFYLTAADGDKPYTFDRIIRGKGLHIPALCLSIIGGIQPGVLAEYVRQATGGGAGADGLLQRFGLMVYPDISPNWKEVDRYPDTEAREAVNQLAERLDNLDPDSIGAEADKYGGVPFLRFDNAAQSLFSEWRADLETRLRSGEEHPSIISHLAKYRKLIPSLALINHLCDGGRGAVTLESLLRAIAFSEYLEGHARRIYSYATRPDIDAAKTLLKRLQTGKLPTPFKGRDIYRAGWTGLETPAKAQAAISLLQEYRHLSEELLETGGRSTSQFHWINGGKA